MTYCINLHIFKIWFNFMQKINYLMSETSKYFAFQWPVLHFIWYSACGETFLKCKIHKYLCEIFASFEILKMIPNLALFWEADLFSLLKEFLSLLFKKKIFSLQKGIGPGSSIIPFAGGLGTVLWEKRLKKWESAT